MTRLILCTKVSLLCAVFLLAACGKRIVPTDPSLGLDPARGEDGGHRIAGVSASSQAGLSAFVDPEVLRRLSTPAGAPATSVPTLYAYAQAASYFETGAQTIGGFLTVLNDGTTPVSVHLEQFLQYSVAGASAPTIDADDKSFVLAANQSIQFGLLNRRPAVGKDGTLGYFGRVLVIGSSPVRISGDVLTSSSLREIPGAAAVLARFVNVPFAVTATVPFAPSASAPGSPGIFGRQFTQCLTPVGALEGQVLVYNPARAAVAVTASASLRYAARSSIQVDPLASTSLALRPNEAKLVTLRSSQAAADCHSSGFWEGRLVTRGATRVVAGTNVLVAKTDGNASFRSRERQNIAGQVGGGTSF